MTLGVCLVFTERRIMCLTAGQRMERSTVGDDAFRIMQHLLRLKPGGHHMMGRVCVCV